MRHRVLLYQALAAFTLQVLELFGTLDQEIELIWCRPWTWNKSIFLFNRYGALATQGVLLYHRLRNQVHPYSDEECRSLSTLRVLSYAMFMATIQLVLLTRVAILYHKRRWLVRGLFFFYVIELSIFLLANVQHLRAKIPYDDFCVIKKLHGFESYAAALVKFTRLPAFILDSALFILTVVKVFELWRGRYGLPLLLTLIRDEIFYYFVIWATLIAFTATSPTTRIFNASGWYITSLSVTSGRLILNLLCLGNPGQRPITPVTCEAMTTIPIDLT